MYLGNFKENREQQGIGKIEIENCIHNNDNDQNTFFYRNKEMNHLFSMLNDCNKNNNKIKSYKTKAEVVVKTTMCIEKHRDWRLGRLMLGAWG